MFLRFSLRRLVFLAVLSFLIITLSIMGQKPPRQAAVAINTPVIHAPNIVNQRSVTIVGKKASQKRNVHFLLPATAINKLACRTIFSAELNGYPAPVLVNFDATFRNAAEARFMKIAAIHRYLQLRVADDDLVLIMDAYDTWFQLSFDTFISRYYKLQELDRAHHYEVHAKDATVPEFLEQAIFGGDKVCWPNPPNSAACKNVPQSTLPKNIYGPETDKDKYQYRWRPRWLNSGNIIGPGSVLKEVYKRAFDIQQKSTAHYSDQLIIADIYGMQDLPIRIDYESYLFQTMTHSHSDIMFIQDEQIEVDDIAALVHRPYLPSGVHGINTPKNSPQRRGESDDDYALRKLVDDAFYTNTSSLRVKSEKNIAWNRITGNSPAVLHFNGPKVALETWWNKMWWVYDQSPVNRLQRLKKVRKTGGMFIDDDGTKFATFKEMCGMFDVYEHTSSPVDNMPVTPGSWPSLDPEPFRLGMDPTKSPSDGWKALLADQQKQQPQGGAHL
ncbi:uncharacterized protein V1518DRAFT_397759 [Limtongia smithiae]|uniref:uncharacterized protein n=1 Tax=Limtongia smithiae TaxID=1125753 RepID=UPI0034CF87F3